MAKKSNAHGIGLVLSLLVCACGSEGEFGSDLAYDDDLEFRDDGGSSTRRPGGGIWIGNGLHDPTASRVNPQFGLSTPEGLAEHSDLIDDPDTIDTVEYLVECALAPYQSITKTVDGETVEFFGQLGLAPEWEADACDEECQQWVTACLLARTNVSGQEVFVGLRSDHEAVGTQPTPNFPKYEASWYGNLFAPTPTMYFCEGNGGGQAAAQMHGRTCSTGDNSDCGFVSAGSCFDPGRCAQQQGTRVECTADGVSYKTLSTYLPDN